MSNEIKNINVNLDKDTINELKTTKYKCNFHHFLPHNDIVCAIDLDKNYLVYGTLMGEVYLCQIDDFSLFKQNDINDSNITYAKELIDNGKKNEEKNCQKNGNFGVGDEPTCKIRNKKNKKNGKDIKIFLNKEPDSDDLQQTEDINSNNLKDKIKSSKTFLDKIMNNYYNKFRIKKLYKNKIENISCVSLSDDILNFSIGDYQLFHCEKISSFIGKDITKTHNFKKITNYTSDKAHNEFCETAQCFMANNHYLILYLYYYDFNWPLKFNEVRYKNIDMSNFCEIRGNIYMSNFNVPFDFDGDKFLYLEYYSKTLRGINIFSTLKEQKLFQYFIKNDFEHISFMKLLPDDSIFLCRKIYLCEIYNIKYNNNIDKTNKLEENEIHNDINNNKEDFILLKSWIHHPNNEIISSNVCIIKNKNKYNNKENKEENDELNLIQTKIIKEKEKKIKNRNVIKSLILIEKNNSNDSYSESKNKIFQYKSSNYSNNIIEDAMYKDKEKSEILKIKLKSNKNINDYIEEKIKYYIITLDIEGNFNMYCYNSEKNEEIKMTLFNLYNIQNIEKKYKDTKFFSLGFPYYITMNENYYIITTDNGIFVINSEKI